MWEQYFLLILSAIIISNFIWPAGVLCGLGLSSSFRHEFGKQMQIVAEQFTELSAYATNDVEITAQLASIMIPKVEPEIEFWIMDHTNKMFLTKPFSVDAGIAGNKLSEVNNHLNSELASSGYTHPQISKDSAFFKLLATALAVTGRAVSMKRGKNGQIPAISSDDGVMQAFMHDSDPQVKKLAGRLLLYG